MERKTVEVKDETDVATFLAGIAADCRAAALVLEGFVRQEGNIGDARYSALMRLGGSLDRQAEALDAVRKVLCADCRLVEVRQSLVVLAGPERGTRFRDGGSWCIPAGKPRVRDGSAVQGASLSWN